MDFREILTETEYVADLKGGTKEEVLRELVHLLVGRGRIRPEAEDAVYQAVWEREQDISTGIQDGIAMPHGRIAEVDRLVTLLALKKEGMDFEALDGNRTCIFAFSVVSPLDPQSYMEYLGNMSKALGRASVREALLAAETDDAMRRILLDAL